MIQVQQASIDAESAQSFGRTDLTNQIKKYFIKIRIKLSHRNLQRKKISSKRFNINRI